MMEGRLLKFFFSPRTPGVVEFASQFGPMYHFANVEVDHGDILEYDEDGTPVTAWSKYSAPDEILQEAGRQDETRTAERLREIDVWRATARAKSED